MQPDNIGVEPFPRTELEPTNRTSVLSGLSFPLFAPMQPIIPSKHQFRAPTVSLEFDVELGSISILMTPYAVGSCGSERGWEKKRWNPAEYHRPMAKVPSSGLPEPPSGIYQKGKNETSSTLYHTILTQSGAPEGHRGRRY